MLCDHNIWMWYMEHIISSGGEGVILQQCGSHYEQGRSLSLIKLKVYITPTFLSPPSYTSTDSTRRSRGNSYWCGSSSHTKTVCYTISISITTLLTHFFAYLFFTYSLFASSLFASSLFTSSFSSPHFFTPCIFTFLLPYFCFLAFLLSYFLTFLLSYFLSCLLSGLTNFSAQAQ
jgi:hypothetical protein